MKDVVCKTDVNADTARAKPEYHGHSSYLCEPSCLQKFQSEPRKYATDTSAVPPAASAVKRQAGGQAAEWDCACPMAPMAGICDVRHPHRDIASATACILAGGRYSLPFPVDTAGSTIRMVRTHVLG